MSGRASGTWRRSATPRTSPTRRATPPEAGADPSRPVDGVAPDIGGPAPRLPWRSAPTHAQGGVDFVGVFDPPEHITGYALAEVWSSKDREAVFSIGSDDRSRIWLDGQLIHEFDPPADAAPPPPPLPRGRPAQARQERPAGGRPLGAR